VNGVKVGGTAARQGGCNTELSLGSTLAAVGWRKRVTVRAEEAQIFQPVVSVVTVYVVELERNG
jgi:hypothetical protein